ncbi:hypothetical protein ACLMO3_20565 [Yersinia enterocolitica]|uniref:hypothetical protein n=1 Tax=Yersinia enterocolitica TaxID=630 RepID=UPI00398CE66C
MKITRSIIESDMNIILESVQSYDYEIPSTKEIMIYPLKVLGVLYSTQIILFIASLFLHSIDNVGVRSLESIILMIGGGAFASLPIIMATYSNAAMYLCLDKAVRDRSVLISLLKTKLKSYLKVYFLVNTVVATIFTFYVEWGFLVINLSYFVTTIIFCVVFNMSIGRYFTPGVFAVIGKIKDILSPSTPAAVEK